MKTWPKKISGDILRNGKHGFVKDLDKLILLSHLNSQINLKDQRMDIGSSVTSKKLSTQK
jgi:hypothetical protein